FVGGSERLRMRWAWTVECALGAPAPSESSSRLDATKVRRPGRNACGRTTFAGPRDAGETRAGRRSPFAWVSAIDDQETRRKSREGRPTSWACGWRRAPHALGRASRCATEW